MSTGDISAGLTKHSTNPESGELDLQLLLQEVARGEECALGKVYDATSRLVFGLVMRILGDRTVAEEVLIDVYAQVWRQSATYERRRGTPLAWLATIARSRAIDRLRAVTVENNRHIPLEAVSDGGETIPDGDRMSVCADKRIMVRQALDSLPPEQREVIELAYYSGMSHSEIAARLDQPLGTVKTRIRLAMLKLRDILIPAAVSPL